mgnify:CR=1 FL=1
MNSSDIQSIAKRVIEIEAEAVSLIGNRIDSNFESAVQSILECTGRLIVSGMGKSGLISQKIAATMASTGTPSHFVHPGEATHGDLGMITKEDIVNLRYVSSPAMGPKGDNVCYVLSVPRMDEEKPGPRHSQIWVKRATDQGPVQFTSSAYDSYFPQWTSDGTGITFLSKRKELSEHTQLFRIPIDGGEASLFLEHSAGIGLYRWSPDGQWLAFLSTDTLSAEKKKAMEKGYDMLVKDKYHRYQRLWLYNISTGKTELIFKNDIHVHDFIWSDDSKTIVFQGTGTPGADPSLMDRILYRVNLPRNLPRKILDTPGKLGPMDISPDGKNWPF